MGTRETEKKRHRANESTYAYQNGRGRHAHRANSVTKYDQSTSNTQMWTGQEQLPLPFAPSTGMSSDASKSPFNVTEFTMFVEDNDQPVHYFTQLSPNGRMSDLNVMDVSTWRRQYPEFDFLRPQTEGWMKQNRRVLVCDASIKVLTETRPNSDLSITFLLHASRDLSIFNSVQCITRFFDSGNMAPDPQFDGHDARDLKEHQTPCHYMPDPMGPSGYLRVAFGSKFWVNRMLKYQSLRHKDEGCVSRSLLRLTATQDVYGVKANGAAECVLTILWRFTQTTRSSAEVGSMNWRAVTFGNHVPEIEAQWDTNGNNSQLQSLNHEQTGAMELSVSESDNMSMYHQLALHVSVPTDDTFARQSTHLNQPPPLNLDILASLQTDIDTPHASTATSASADFSQHSLSTLAHSQDSVASFPQDANDFNFDGGHITLTGAFGPAINLAAYDEFTSEDAGLDGLQALAGLDQDGYNLGLACGNHDELVDVSLRHDLSHGGLSCYSTKPSWHHNNLVPSLENAAEQYHTYDTNGQTTHGHDNTHLHQSFSGPSPALTQQEDLIAQLHNAQHVAASPAIWNLQSPFQEDTGSGAHDGGTSRTKNMLDCRKDSVGQGMGGGHGLGLGLGVLGMIQREQRAWEA